MLRLPLAILALLLAGQTIAAKVVDKNATIAGMTIYYLRVRMQVLLRALHP